MKKKIYENQFSEIETEDIYIEEPHIENYQINEIIKLLTLITIILLVATIGIAVIAGFFIELKLTLMTLTEELSNLTK